MRESVQCSLCDDVRVSHNIIKKYNDAKVWQEGKVQFIDGIRKITFKN